MKRRHPITPYSPEGWIPDSTRWLINEQDRVLGAVNIRHKLTEHLYNAGGHIGYANPKDKKVMQQSC
jgi:predicted acetyltransferase